MMSMENVSYLNGFGNEFESECDGYPDSLPKDQINPQSCKYGLFAEQLSGTAFTAPRNKNRRSWLYRLQPSVATDNQFRKGSGYALNMIDFGSGESDPNQRRWSPFGSNRLSSKVDFVEGLHTLGYSDATGCAPMSVAIHVYLANANMIDKCFMNSDGDMLIVPQQGTLQISTEFGPLIVEPNEIVVIQQGMKFSVSSHNDQSFARGYVLEVKGNHFELPYLGPIGANGLANPRDFQTPKARLSEPLRSGTSFRTVVKFQNQLFHCEAANSPFNVVAWFGNYVPFKYNLKKFVSVNSVSVDHPDPSIFTVLTCPSIGQPGTALADFVIFPPRWECAKNTFRPPYFHRNCMTEFMGLIEGKYQAKSQKFAPGGGSLHQSMIPHGPDLDCFLGASAQDTSQPARVADGTMAFMFETCLSLKLTRWAREENVDPEYHKCWEGLARLKQDRPVR